MFRHIALSLLALAIGAIVQPALADTAAAVAPDPDLTHQALLNDPATPTGGNTAGDVTIVAFFDYNCPYCMKSEPELEKLLQVDRGVRVVYKDWPIFGANSTYAARVALAAQWQGKYIAVHNALLGTHRAKTSQSAIRSIAAEAGADMAQLDRDMAAHATQIDAVLARTEKQADKLQLPGTPVFLIGPYLVESALDLDGFQREVAAARAKTSGTQ
jgi:protein-disulfide isomerase